MSLNMLIETAGGRNYAPAEYRAWMEDADLREVRVVWFEAAGANGAVIGYKPINESAVAFPRRRSRVTWRLV
jgi:hypothetical protein